MVALRHEVLFSRCTIWRITWAVITRKGNRVTGHVPQTGLLQVKRLYLQHFNRGRRSFSLYRWLAYFMIIKIDNVSMNPGFKNYELETRKSPASLLSCSDRQQSNCLFTLSRFYQDLKSDVARLATEGCEPILSFH